MAWLTLLLASPLLLVVALTTSTTLRLLRNYLAARTIGVPIRFIPISPLNPFWTLADRGILGLLRRLPFGDNSFTRYNWRGWEVEDRYKSHQEMGDMWVLVTPLKNWVYVNDPGALMSIFKRGPEFPRPVFVNEILNVFGPNISTAEGESWKTQRRIATRCFNEQNNEIVWEETITLARDMLEYWTSKTSVPSIADDLRTLSLHVLSRAGFGKSFKFQGHDQRKHSVDPSVNYKESLQIILENCVLILGFGTKFISYPWLPSNFRTVHKAWISFHAYMTGVYEDEKRKFAEGQTSDHNLMTLLIRASQEDQEKTSVGLTESEIYGNMFAFNFAGHDTTANTFTFAVYFLAANPQVQDWLSEEICAVLGDRDPHTWDYRADFPRLRRCLSAMLETMRLYTPVPIIKWTGSGNESRQLVVNGKTFVLPPHSMIAPSYGSVQTDPRFWGDDSLLWRPSRWMKAGSPGEEEMDLPARGAFLGWSEGTRDCPGRKFSQVEFAATMAVLFRRSRVRPEAREGETPEAARARILQMIEKESGTVLLLQLLHPERSPLVWDRL
ncbi:putative cytochrome P450 [Rosellinia necatrix]|uniref:Putative cytochrome P450 n=1 Tax=Rosellinia necatrix TaxID=77044 RepID=A0A1W2TKG8_ROSNE|nr:putative cytochrome P450 [Rosellinia necatrix]